jgi:4-amino-4-deoxy-L-arabinose transferase-like glycosyltransferase
MTDRGLRAEGPLSHAFPAALAVAAGLIFLLNLGNHYLWQDEAQTALLAQTVLDRGMPYGTDGKNFFSQELGVEYGENHIWKWHTWLPFYLVAGSFALLGETTFAARLPFALFGIGTVIMVYYFGTALWRDRFAGGAAAVMLLTSVPFLILSRQCRYYSTAAFLSLLGLWAYLRLAEGKRGALATFVAAGTLLFHTNYVYCASLLAAVGAHWLLLDRRESKKMAWGFGWVVSLCAPWVAWLSGIRYGAQYAEIFLQFDHAWFQIRNFVEQLGYQALPLVGLAALAAGAATAFVLGKRPPVSVPPLWKAVLLPVSFIAVTLGMLALTAPFHFFRYLAPLIPPLMALAGLLAGLARRAHVVVGVAAVAVAVAAQPLRDYCYELMHDYDGPIEGIVRFLEENASPDDMVAMTYGDLPVKFYTGLRVVGGLAGEDLSVAEKADWVVIRRNTVSTHDMRFRRYLLENLDPDRYRAITLDAVDIRFENRESPYEHLYRTVRDGPKVVMLERIGD